MLVVSTASRDGRSVTVSDAHIFDLRDGKVAEFHRPVRLRRARRLTGLRGNAAMAGQPGRGWAGDWLHRSYVGCWTRSR